MYCPQCGQQQIADNLNFCSRCGLPINEVAKWLEGNASLATSKKGTPLKSHSARRKGIRRGAKLMFISCVLFPIFFLLVIVFDSPIPLLVPFTIFLAGLSQMLYSRIFGDDSPSIKTEQTQSSKLGSMLGNKILPSVSGMWIKRTAEPQFQTAELIKPPSITEHTTTLLDKNNNTF
jgi:hypothetical protein